MSLTVTISGGKIYWNGPDKPYNVYGKCVNNDVYTYASNISAHYARIWSPAVTDLNTDISLFYVESADLTVNGTITYSLGRLTYNGGVITAFTGANIIVPEKQNGVPISSFGNVFQGSAIQELIFYPTCQIASIVDNAFNGSTLIGITIPCSVTSIGSYAFHGCLNLDEVVFDTESKCKTIGANAFSNSNLLRITIPRSVRRIGSSALNGCTSLSKIIFEGLPPSYDTGIYNLTDANGFYYYMYHSYWPTTYDTIPMYAIPDNLSLNVNILTWNGPTDVSYNIYVTGVLHVPVITGLSQDISSQLQYGKRFQVSSAMNGIESPLSNPVFIMTNSGSYDCMIAKYDSNGNVQWATRIAGSGNDTGTDITTDAYTNVLVSGFYRQKTIIYNENGDSVSSLSISGTSDCFIAKYGSDGNVQWVTRIAGGTIDYSSTNTTDAANNILVSLIYNSPILTLYNADGSSFMHNQTNSGSYDSLIAKYSPAGTVLWAARIAGTGFESFPGISVDAANNVLVVGGYTSTPLTIYDANGNIGVTLENSGSYDGYIAKYNPEGTFLWATRISGTGDDRMSGVDTDTENSILVLGTYTNNPLTLYNTNGSEGATLVNSGNRDCFVVKYNSEGLVLWATRIAGILLDSVTCIHVDKESNILITGYYQSNPLIIYNANGYTGATLPNTNESDCFIAKYSPNGNVQWATRIGGPYADLGLGINTDKNNNILVSGSFNANSIAYNVNNTLGVILVNTGSQDGFLVKYDASGFVLWAARIASAGSDEINIAESDEENNIFTVGNYFTNNVAIYNAICSYTPTNIYLTNTTLTWYGPSIVVYNVYVANILRLSGITGLSVDISDQLQYGVHFQVSAVANSVESPPSDTVVSSIIRAPTDLSLNGTILSWSGPSDVSYAIYYTTPTGYTLILRQSTTSFNIQNYSGLRLLFIVRSTYNAFESPASLPIQDMSEITGSSIDPITYIQQALDASSINMLKYNLINNPSSFSSSVVNLESIDMTKFVSSISSDASLNQMKVSFLLPNADISSSALPDPSSSLYLLGDVNSTVIYRIDGIEQTVYFDVISITINGITSTLGSNFVFSGKTYKLVGIGSGLGSPSTKSDTKPNPRPKKISAKALRAANSFCSSSARTRMVAGREVIRSMQSSSKRHTMYPDALMQVIAAQNYIRGK